MDKVEFGKLNKLAVDFLRNEGPKLQRQAWLYSWTVRNYVTVSMSLSTFKLLLLLTKKVSF